MALSSEDKADVKGAMGAALASKVSKVTRDGFDGNKRWGNSAQKGHGVNSPAMMEARSKVTKDKNHPVSGHSQWLTHQVKKDNPAYYALERRALKARRADSSKSKALQGKSGKAVPKDTGDRRAGMEGSGKFGRRKARDGSGEHYEYLEA